MCTWISRCPSLCVMFLCCQEWQLLTFFFLGSMLSTCMFTYICAQVPYPRKVGRREGNHAHKHELPAHTCTHTKGEPLCLFQYSPTLFPCGEHTHCLSPGRSHSREWPLHPWVVALNIHHLYGYMHHHHKQRCRGCSEDLHLDKAVLLGTLIKTCRRQLLTSSHDVARSCTLTEVTTTPFCHTSDTHASFVLWSLHMRTTNISKEGLRMRSQECCTHQTHRKIACLRFVPQHHLILCYRPMFPQFWCNIPAGSAIATVSQIRGRITRV